MASGPVQAEDLRSILMTKDDLLHCFYIFLWSKGPDGLGVKGVRIPDTVILNHSRVLEYYFTSKEGSVKRKARANLVTSHLLEQLEKHNRKCQQSGIVASILTRDSAAPTGLSVVPYTMDALRPVLVEGSIGSGTMQFFVEPKKEGAAAHNACVGVQWTPNITYMDKRTNVFPIAAPSTVASLKAKTTLEDGSTNVRISQTISSRVSAEIDRVCRAIAEHFLLVFKARILHMGLEFKVDAKEQTWLTHCFSLKLADVSAPTKVMYALHLKEASGDGLDGDDMSTAGSVKASTASAAGGAMRRGSDASLAGDDRSVSRASNAGSVAPSHASRGAAGGAAGLRRGNAARRPINGRGGGGGQQAMSKVRCAVCGTQGFVQPSLVARHNLLFPLSLLAFFCSHPPGTVFVDDAKVTCPEAVPDYVAMMHENEHTPCDGARGGGGGVRDELDDGEEEEPHIVDQLSLAEYDALRREPEWLNAQMHCCRGCTEELREVVESLVIGGDGKIRVPGNPSEGLGGDHHQPTRMAPVGAYAKTTAAQQARIDASQRKAPPPKAQGPSPYAADLTLELRSKGGAKGKAGGGSRSVSRMSGGTPTPSHPAKSSGAAGPLPPSARESGTTTPVTLPPLPPSRKSSMGGSMKN